MRSRLAAAALVVVAAVLVQVTVVTGATSATPSLSRVARGFQNPVLVVQAPGQPTRLYVVEQTGYVRVLDKGKRRAKPFLDVHTRITAGGEQGLLGLAFPPDYATRKKVYVNYTDTTGATTIVEFPVRNDTAVASRGRQLLKVSQPYSNHNGGNLVFGPDGLLWVGLGDGGSGGDPESRGQNPDTLLGKLFTLDTRSTHSTPKLRGIGLRNPWRYSFDRRTGDLWIGDVGQGDLEEVDVVRKPVLRSGGLLNFGWSVYEGTKRFSDRPLGPGRLVKPITEYSHGEGCSITGGFVYRGKAVPSLRGRYLFGDYCEGTVWSIPATGGAARKEPISVPSLTSFGEALSGELYAVSQDGTIYRIVT